MLKQSLKSKLAQIHPIQLGYLNTPLDPLPRLSKALGGPEIRVKRDNLTGLATGGNKVRKLNFVLADVLAHKPDLVLTAGGLQSNQARSVKTIIFYAAPTKPVMRTTTLPTRFYSITRSLTINLFNEPVNNAIDLKLMFN